MEKVILHFDTLAQKLCRIDLRLLFNINAKTKCIMVVSDASYGRNSQDKRVIWCLLCIISESNVQLMGLW